MDFHILGGLLYNLALQFSTVRRYRQHTHTHTGATRQEKEKAENLKKKMSVSGVGGSAANVAPAVSWSLSFFFTCQRQEYLESWVPGTLKPTIFLFGCLVISNLFFFGNDLESSSWNNHKKVVVWSSRWTWWWFQIFFVFIPQIGEELWTHFDERAYSCGWVGEKTTNQWNMVVSTMFDAIGISTWRGFPSCT